jgi:hypothetical protein
MAPIEPASLTAFVSLPLRENLSGPRTNRCLPTGRSCSGRGANRNSGLFGSLAIQSIRLNAGLPKVQFEPKRVIDADFPQPQNLTPSHVLAEV